MKKGSKKRALKYFAIFMTIVFAISFLYGVFNYTLVQDTLSTQIEDYGFWAIFLSTIFLEIIPQYLSPHNTLLIAALFELNPYMAFVSVALGSIVGSLAGFIIGRKYGYGIVEEFLGKKKM